MYKYQMKLFMWLTRLRLTVQMESAIELNWEWTSWES